MAGRMLLALSLTLWGCASPRGDTGSVVAPAPSPVTVAVEPPPGAAAHEREVIRVAERLFDAMRTRDTVALRELLAPDLRMTVVRVGANGSILASATTEEFIRRIATSTGELRERMWRPEVRMDDALATLWAPYVFHIGERFSHCGHDAFQMARGDRGWTIVALSYTVRTTGCEEPPPAP